MNSNNVIYYTDGACSGGKKPKDFGNDPFPSPGAFAIIGTRNNEKFMTHDHYEPLTTSNRMELSAVLWVVENAYTPHMIILSDSQYVVNGFNIWMKNWKKRNWVNASGNKVLNQDLWKSLDISATNKILTLKWIRGHNNNFYNEEVDRIAKNKIITSR